MSDPLNQGIVAGGRDEFLTALKKAYKERNEEIVKQLQRRDVQDEERKRLVKAQEDLTAEFNDLGKKSMHNLY